ncbi:glycosyltransferase [bacterium]|nr:glycosyltransferase [bacterium]
MESASVREEHPKVSVIMPVYNAEKFLPKAIESIVRQTFANFEYIIIDDGSTDQSWAIIQQYAVKDKRIVAKQNQKNLHISRTLNRCLQLAQGEYIARMDADDVSDTQRLAKQVVYMDANPDIGISGGTMILIDEHGDKTGHKRRYHLTDDKIRKFIFRYSPFCHPAIMVRKRVLDVCGDYNSEYDWAEDYELYFRLGQQTKFGNIQDVLLYYRVLEKSITTSRTKVMETKTLAIRQKAVREYGYTMTLFDKVYWILQYLSIRMIPYQWKRWIYSKIASWR